MYKIFNFFKRDVRENMLREKKIRKKMNFIVKIS